MVLFLSFVVFCLVVPNKPHPNPLTQLVRCLCPLEVEHLCPNPVGPVRLSTQAIKPSINEHDENDFNSDFEVYDFRGGQKKKKKKRP